MTRKRWAAARCLHLALLLPVTALAAPTSKPTSKPTSAPASHAAAPAPAVPRYNLRQLLEMAHTSYPGIRAMRHAVSTMEQQFLRAKWAWLPQGNLRGFLAPVPEIRCEPSAEQCTKTNASQANLGPMWSFKGVMVKLDLDIGMPLFTFGKMAAVKRAASSGVAIRKEELASARNRLIVDVTRGYWGLKLAREILFTLNEGLSHLVDAEKTVQKDIDEGEGEFTLNDLLRLQTARAEIDVRFAEAEKAEAMALAGLATVTGKQGQPFDVDTAIISVLDEEPRPVRTYLEMAHANRPELRILEEAVKARTAGVDLERARFFPDFLFVAMLGVANSSTIDIPYNAYYNNPFNYYGAGFGLAMNWRWDYYQQYRQFRVAKLELEEIKARREEGNIGIDLEVRRAWHDLREARARLAAAKKGERTARKWVATVQQNLAAGLAETRDMTDSLLSFFQLRVRHLWAMFDVNVAWSELGRVVGTRATR
jgi:outer membrane protein TolC